MAKVLRNSRGQGLIEYVILVAIIAIGTMGMVRVLQKSMKVNLATVVYSLQGDDKRKASHERIEDSDLKKTDFSDFMNGAANVKD
jgi:pilus assembly protein Flp/PilA